MANKKDTPQRSNRIKEALSRIYHDEPAQFREFLRRYKEDPMSRVFVPLAEAYRRQGRFEEAIDICERGIKHHPDYISGHLTLSKCYLDLGNYLKAKDILEPIAKKIPENLMAQRLLAESWTGLGDHSAALHHFRMALVLSPEDVALAEKVHELEKNVTPEALAHYSQKIQEPTDPAKAETISNAVESPTPENELEENFTIKPVRDNFELFLSHSSNGPDIENLSETGDSEWNVSSPFTEEEQRIGISRVLGISEEDEIEEPYSTRHVSHLFQEESKKEITTETLADLYYLQGQYDKALRIFDRIYKQTPSTSLAEKIKACRGQLGVDPKSAILLKKIDLLRGVLTQLHENPPVSDAE